MARKGAKGGGTIRKKTVTRSGKEYTYWEARVTVGRDPGTGKQIQHSFTGKTQKEVREKMQTAAVAINQGTYTEPSKLTVGQWADIWLKDYTGGIKASTLRIYQNNTRLHIKPALGAMRLSDLHPHDVQGFINGLDSLSPSSVKLAYRVLHQVLQKAVDLEYIPKNPAYNCVLPKQEQSEIHPLDDGQVAALLQAARGGDLEHILTIALFAGLRLSEILGLTWPSVENGVIVVDKQLVMPSLREETGVFTSPKSGKPRTIAPAPSVLEALKRQKVRQAKMQLQAGPLWDNAYDLVFTTETGGPVSLKAVEYHFSKLAASAGLEGVRFHDTRHTYAVNAIRAGDDIKTVQGNLGHATAAFTLDRYGHFTERMAKDSANRMEGFIKGVLGL